MPICKFYANAANCELTISNLQISIHSRISIIYIYGSDRPRGLVRGRALRQSMQGLLLNLSLQLISANLFNAFKPAPAMAFA